MKRITSKQVLFILIPFWLLLGITPVVSTIINVLFRSDYSLAKFFSLFFTSYSSLGTSVIIAISVAFIATAAGLMFGILLVKINLPARNLIAVLIAVPLFLPPYINAVSWANIFGKKGMLFSIFGSRIADISSSFFFSEFGVIFVLSLSFLPIAVLLVMAGLSAIPANLEEAARLHTSWGYTIRKITIPMITPSIIASASIIFLFAVGEFSVPMTLRVPVFTTDILTQFSAFYNFEHASSLSIFLALVTLGIISIERIYETSKSYSAPSKKDTFSVRIHPGKWKIPIFIILLSLCGIIILPYLFLAVKAGSFQAIITSVITSGSSIIRGFAFSLVSAGIVTLIGFLFTIAVTGRKQGNTIETLMLFCFAMPSIVIGIGLVNLWNNTATQLIYHSSAIIIVGYIGQNLYISYKILRASYYKVPASYIEAAALSGAGWFGKNFYITFPLLKEALLASFVLSFIFCFKDLGITMIVYPAGMDTFPVRLLTMMANSSESYIAAQSLVMVLATIVPLCMAYFYYTWRKIK
ncbi:MAG: iron ABC transporter permease [bacterium]|nr:iron ABC transporter permease [bacterium]